MFKKRKCEKCKSKIDKNFEFCPFCGKPVIKNNQNDWGMLGKMDFEGESMIGFPMGLSSIFNNLVKTLRQMEGTETKFTSNKKSPNPTKTGGISISISTSGNSPPKIKINSMGNIQKEKEETYIKNIQQMEFKSRNLKGFSSLPKVEPQTKIRRFSDKIIYEIDLPGVKLLKDISITKLENGIEIKAISKDKAYEKAISINLPIIRKNFLNEKLILELDVKN